MCDILQGMDIGEGTLALALDLKGAFNSVLHEVLVRQLVNWLYYYRLDIS